MLSPSVAARPLGRMFPTPRRAGSHKRKLITDFFVASKNSELSTKSQDIVRTRCHLTDLPAELLHQILVQLNFQELSSVSLVCRRLSLAATSPPLWADFTFDTFSLTRDGLSHYLTVLQLPR